MQGIQYCRRRPTAANATTVTNHLHASPSVTPPPTFALRRTDAPPAAAVGKPVRNALAMTLVKEYTQSTLPHRCEISALYKAGQGPTQMAGMLGAHRTTISRELKRNRSPNGHFNQPKESRFRCNFCMVTSKRWSCLRRKLETGRTVCPCAP